MMNQGGKMQDYYN